MTTSDKLLTAAQPCVKQYRMKRRDIDFTIYFPGYPQGGHHFWLHRWGLNTAVSQGGNQSESRSRNYFQPGSCWSWPNSRTSGWLREDGGLDNKPNTVRKVFFFIISHNSLTSGIQSQIKALAWDRQFYLWSNFLLIWHLLQKCFKSQKICKINLQNLNPTWIVKARRLWVLMMISFSSFFPALGSAGPQQ